MSTSILNDDSVKSCPFCGGRPFERESLNLIECSVCGAHTSPHGDIGLAISQWQKREYESGDDIQLKNCPFCNNEPVIEESNGVIGIFCYECAIGFYHGSRGSCYKDVAMIKWNRRIN